MTEVHRVLRILRAQVKPGREAEWNRVLDDVIPEQLEGADGLIAWYRGKALSAESDEHVVVTLWRDKDSVRAWAGASTRPVVFPDMRDLANSINVEQFEVD